MKSIKEQALDEKLLKRVGELTETYSPDDRMPLEVAQLLLTDPEVKAMQDYANSVSIMRAALNDHGPVHMRIVCLNALKIIGILREARVIMSLEKEGTGTLADSIAAVMIASMLHDAGMTIGRKDHELYSGIVSFSIITSLLAKVLPGDENITRRTVIRSLAMEGILGHMGTRPIHSLEAGIILVSDGCDMTKGRARIPMEYNTRPMEGDIHKYSAAAIDKVKIRAGSDKPLQIEVQMRESVGFFQVEQVLIPKLKASTIRPYVELYAGVADDELKRYM